MQLEDFSFIFMGVLILIILYILIGKYLEHKHIHIIHQTGIGILIGLIFGLVMFFTKHITDLNFDEEIFFYGLLPPMIFAGGYNLKKDDFEKNFKYIFLFGFLGTVTAFGVIFGLTYLIDTLEWIVPIGEPVDYEYMDVSLIVKYSATISATDSVAALTLINPAQYPKLFSIIFGEGMVNDAVAIILFKVVGDIVQDITGAAGSDMGAGEIMLQIVGQLLLTIFASIGIGAMCAIICSFCFKNFRFLVQNEITQVVITYLFGILSYVIAETLNMSGVITVLVCGILLAHYNYYNLTPGGMHSTTVSFQFIAFLAEAIVFVYLGLSIVYYFNEVYSITFIAAEIVICFFARFVAIFGLAFIFKFCMKWKVPNNELSVVCASGTIRGSVALALILTIEGKDTNEHKVSIIKSTVLIMVCMTTIVMGGVMPKLISYFMGSKSQISEPSVNTVSEESTESKEKKKERSLLKIFENKYMKKWLIYNYAENKETFKMYKRVLKPNSTEEGRKQFNKMFVLRDLGLSYKECPEEVQNRTSSFNSSPKESLMSSGVV